MSRPNISHPIPVNTSSFPSGSASASGARQPEQNYGQMQGKGRQASGSGSGGASRPGPTMLDSSITRLLVVTKQMLQALEQWSQGQVSEEDVSDIYVKLGNGFEQCVDAFRRVGIATKELDSIPQDLRVCLEQALAEEPSKETLDVYLPDIRSIIYNLLNGLKQKQAAYKRLVAERQAETPPPPPPPRDPVAEANAKLTARAGTPASQGSISPSSTHSGLPTLPSSQALAERSRNASATRAAPPPDAFRPPRRTNEAGGTGTARRMSGSPQPHITSQPLPQPGSSATKPASTPPSNIAHGLIRHQLSDNPVPATLAPAPSVKPTPPRPDRFSRDSFGNPRPVSRFSVDSEITNGSPIRSPTAQSPPHTIGTLPETEAESEESVPSLTPALPLLNLPSALIDIPPPTVKTPPPPPTDTMQDVPQATRSTLAALQRSDPLERRASKRFSSYTFNKMVPGSPGNKKSSVNSPQRPTRRADRAPPLPALPESAMSAKLGVSPDDARSIASSTRTHLQANGNGNGPMSERSSSPTSNRSPSPQPDTDSSMRIVPTPVLEARALAAETNTTGAEQSPAGPSSFSIFLQLGRQVKKATVELPVTFSSLRLLFMERFEYDPGLDDFPEMYLRDNRTGVQFELEDMEDLREGCVLSLNIEVLDQVKQHFDLTVSTLMQELKELKTSFEHSRRLSMMPTASMLSVSPSMNLAAATARPQPKMEATISASPSGTFGPVRPIVLNASKEAELRAQYDEVQSLRRDLAVMRQLHVDFLSETKDSFTKLRAQNSAMREVVKTKMGGSRGLLDNSKAKLEAQCQEAIQVVEEVSDIIDSAREDAYRRFVTPSRTQMANIRANLEKATSAVDQFTRDVTLADPTWRATWASELNRVMEEQKLLSYQSKLSADLKNDIKDAKEMLQAVQDFVDQRAAGIGRAGSKGFRPPSPDQSGGGSGGGIPHLLMEIRTKEADPNSRLKAIEAQQKARERELASREDEFSSELGNFVKGRKLKKTGGTEEAERVRARRTEVTLKKMLTGDGMPGGDNATTGILTPQMTGMSVMSNFSGGGGVNGVLSPQSTGVTERNRYSGGSGSGSAGGGGGG